MDERKHWEDREERTVMRIDNNPDNNFSNMGKKIKSNPWMIASIILGIAVIVLLFMVFRGGITGNVISGEDAGTTIVEYLNGRTGGGVEYVSQKDIGNLYEITVSYQGQDIPVYVTKDGEYFVQGAIPITADVVDDTETETPTDVPKSDKPKVELFIWGYCPYGVQAQGPLAEVASLLGKSADFSAVMYYDGHGPFETQQNKIQECIQDIAPAKYWDYAAGFVEKIYPKCGSSKDIACDLTESTALMKSLGIDSTKVMACVEDKGDQLIAAASSSAKAYGVTGSPSLVINGVKVNTARTAEAYKTAVCDAFNNAPAECSTTLDSSAAASAGNC